MLTSDTASGVSEHEHGSETESRGAPHSEARWEMLVEAACTFEEVRVTSVAALGDLLFSRRWTSDKEADSSRHTQGQTWSV